MMLNRRMVVRLGWFFFLPFVFSHFPFPLLLLAQEAKSPLFELRTVDGSAGTGPLEQLGEDWSVTLAGAKAIQTQGSDFISLRRTRTPLPPRPRDEYIHFANSDQLSGTLVEITGERVRFRTKFGKEQEVALPLAALSHLWLAVPDGVDDVELFSRRLATERRRRDTVLLRNGDRVEGTLVGVDQASARIQDESRKEVRVERNRVAVIALNTELTRSLLPRGPYGRLVLANGSRLSLASARSDGESLFGKTLFGVTVQVPLRQLVALELRQGRAVYLSDLKPRRYEHTGFLGVSWPYVADASVAGRELRLGGSTYDKGIGLHSECKLTYDLAGAYQWFECLVGLDDQTGKEGSVLIQVLLDGKPQDPPGEKEQSGGDAPLPLRMRVAGARELTLVVKFGRHGDVHDHVNWADARLIK